VTNAIVVNNKRALSAMARKAEDCGTTPIIITSQLEGDASEIGKTIGALAKQIISMGSPVRLPCAILFGGETTVTVKGNSKGGRNQELAL
jgi:glycerate 2-kinase